MRIVMHGQKKKIAGDMMVGETFVCDNVLYMAIIGPDGFTHKYTLMPVLNLEESEFELMGLDEPILPVDCHIVVGGCGGDGYE